ncbi:hypothetical protein G7B40_001940 [Aetokthonos hydrillicola Thurmond2011]|jgi:hypothetical protein|uniref:Uncharacterized protein n=1 Tax=Aetokthonos hydrillicola Thurmond2011 TaxID=2712845 RepID=A0AAP5I1C1_9CYAN|nr:hypothetical protein [Aetokthonos hydrillicola]MDR9893348.1 hypothetical protein [Aetokthonos hydrillicola Thurmond2011]
MIAAIESAAKKCKNVGYNKAALAFIEAGGNDTKNPRPQAVNAVIAISRNDELLYLVTTFRKPEFPLRGGCTNFIVSQLRWKITANLKVN